MVEKYKKTNDEFLKELAISKPNIKPLEKYHGVDDARYCRLRTSLLSSRSLPSVCFTVIRNAC